MIIIIDLEDGPSIDEPDVLDAFHAISSTTDDGAVGAAMGAAGHAAGDGHVWVSADWIRRTVDGDPDWATGFDAMLAYAATKGWLDEAGSHIKAHLELA